MHCRKCNRVENAQVIKSCLVSAVYVAYLYVLYDRLYMQGPFLLSCSQLILFHFLLQTLSSVRKRLLKQAAAQLQERIKDFCNKEVG